MLLNTVELDLLGTVKEWKNVLFSDESRSRWTLAYIRTSKLPRRLHNGLGTYLLRRSYGSCCVVIDECDRVIVLLIDECDRSKIRGKARILAPTTLGELKTTVIEEWHNIAQ